MFGFRRRESPVVPGFAPEEVRMSLVNENGSGSERSGVSRMENEGGPPRSDGPNGIGLEQELLALGITCVQIKSFEWGGYRYTNAHDAIAAARRGASS